MAGERESYPMDAKSHEKTYAGFLTIAKWSTIVAAIVTAIVVLLLAD